MRDLKVASSSLALGFLFCRPGASRQAPRKLLTSEHKAYPDTCSPRHSEAFPNAHQAFKNHLKSENLASTIKSN
ncbi:hypothetical protein BJ508DRAFT_79395 [Ascobolus immersus RN42]|uniref:Uncharacterized protein n=1 Tax=Ascobolus immersus RN42 TaxID=1160509 RepID=A0A3N4HES7_ASCIM|nr:hypothetical protein BJ508DRAFT_79395 [Ascobolus immersus RN42]